MRRIVNPYGPDLSRSQAPTGTYLESLGLRELPFAGTADPSFFYAGASARRAIDAISRALSAGEGVLKLTGDPGTGKTTLCRTLLERLDRNAWTSLYLMGGEVDARALTLAIARGLGARPDAADGVNALQRALGIHLLGIARAGRRALVIIDDCQAMSPEALEQVRRLTNLESSKRKLLQILLCGQPAFEAALAAPPVGDLGQRIGCEHKLEILSREEVAAYFDHRLRLAGYSGERLLSRRAAAVLHELSGGLPRLVNALAHKSLELMQADGDRRLEARLIRRAAAESPAFPKRASEAGHEWFWRSVAALLFIGVLWTAWVAYQISPRELVTAKALATAVEGRVGRPPAERALAGDAAPAAQTDREDGRDPAILAALGLPGAKIAAYSPDFALSLARLHAQREDYAAALAALDAAGAEVANRPEYLYLRGSVLQHLGHADLAEEAFRRALLDARNR